MRKSIIIVGALPNDPSRSVLVKFLLERVPSVEWDWVWAQSSTSKPPDKYLIPLWAKSDRNQLSDSIIVKLPMLHGITQNQLHRLTCPVIAAPDNIQTIEHLVDWLLSSDANLVPRHDWLVGTREAALIAIISKLIRGCRWAKDVGGHWFLKQNDLLNQSPVQRSGFEAVRNSALDLLPILIASRVVLQKGAKQGKTPLEYAINTNHLEPLKKMILQRSLTLLPLSSFKTVLDYINADKSEKTINAMDGIVNGQTIEQCQQQHKLDET